MSCTTSDYTWYLLVYTGSAAAVMQMQTASIAYGNLVDCCIKHKQCVPCGSTVHLVFQVFQQNSRPMLPDPRCMSEDNACNAHVHAVDGLLPIAKGVYSLSGTRN